LSDLTIFLDADSGREAAFVTQPCTHRVGSHAWSMRTAGALTSADKRAMAPAVVEKSVRNILGRFAMTAHVNSGRRRELDPDRLTAPKTVLARVAEAHAMARLGPAILNHSRRTYAFGAALGIIDGVDVDRELLYAAALLHDVGLPEGAGAGVDFTAASVAVAMQVADDVGLSSSAAETVASAITMHHSPDVSQADGPTAYLLSAGAAVDVMGLRVSELPPSTIAAIVAEHPRVGFKQEFRRAFREEAARVPRGRARFLMRYAAFGLAIRTAPFRG
jgi:hypothetical protein